jgi:hypothetical protein
VRVVELRANVRAASNTILACSRLEAQQKAAASLTVRRWCSAIAAANVDLPLPWGSRMSFSDSGPSAARTMRAWKGSRQSPISLQNAMNETAADIPRDIVRRRVTA